MIPLSPFQYNIRLKKHDGEKCNLVTIKDDIKLRCPHCSNILTKRGYCKRKIIQIKYVKIGYRVNKSYVVTFYLLPVLVCKHCEPGRWHYHRTYILEIMLPHKHYSTEIIYIAITSDINTLDIPCENSTINRWITRYIGLLTQTTTNYKSFSKKVVRMFFSHI